MLKVPRRSEIDGRRVLYHYLQKDLLSNDIWLFQMLAARLVTSLGIWISPAVYRALPVLLPFAIRDPGARGDRDRGLPDQWGAPTRGGLFRDDNSLIKGLPRSLRVRSTKTSLYAGRRIGRGFVACHVWRKLTAGDLASRGRLTYSFVPNIVWLPAQVAELTDREGSFVQTYLQAIAFKVYRNVDLPDELRGTVEAIWATLPAPSGIPSQGLPGLSDLNFFEADVAWMQRRRRTICDVIDALDRAVGGRSPKGKVVSSRYGAGMLTVDHASVTQLLGELRKYLEALKLPAE